MHANVKAFVDVVLLCSVRLLLSFFSFCFLLLLMDAVSKIAVIFVGYINLTLKQYHVVLESLKPHIKFHPHQYRSVRENEGNRFCFPLTLSRSQLIYLVVFLSLSDLAEVSSISTLEKGKKKKRKE